MDRIGLTLGPLLFNWSAERLRDFYKEVARHSAFDRVHLGEVVCGKRMPFSDRIWPELIGMLQDAGKEVVLSTLALPATPRERRSVLEICREAPLVEINDLTGLPTRTGQPFVVGPLVNVYSEGAASFLAARGAQTICMPVELSLASIGAIAAACREVEIEVFAFGRLPLALSSRCYHARLHGLHKDSCQFVCERDPDGIDVETLEGQPFLAANGIQTLSHGVHAFCPTPAEAAAARIRRLRLSPHSMDMVIAGDIYRAVLDGVTTPARARAQLRELRPPGELVDGYARGVAGCSAVAC